MSEELRSEWEKLEAAANGNPMDDEEAAFAIGRRDGFSEAVQLIDRMTGGNGEYCFSTIGGERHCPDPDAMIARIVGRLALIDHLEADGGVEAMRERCAKLAEEWLQPGLATEHENRCFRDIAKAIRALPVLGVGR